MADKGVMAVSFACSRPKFAGLLGLLLGAQLCSVGAAQSSDERWKREWQVAKGFTLEIDTGGYSFPSSIAFVPNPGTGANDPLYFVTELRGEIKVVTNDRTVYTFAKDFFRLLPPGPPPKGTHRIPELGMAGICLDEENGYVFVSFTYHDENDAVKNNIVRFESKPGTFSLKPTGQLAFTEIFSDQPGSESHMIGPLLVHRGHLYVSVGDAGLASLSQDINFTVGKILRMDLDGKPVVDNPFYQDDDQKDPANYTWAYGFRTPFGTAMVGEQMFVNDNGPGVDRFVRVNEGTNYAYDGSDWSVSSHADVVFAPAVSPVALVHIPIDNELFPNSYRNRFYLTTSGLQGVMGPSDFGAKALLMIRYDFGRQTVIGRPEYLLKYVGKGGQMPVGLALGPDGLYMVPLNPDRSKISAIIKISYDPDNEHPHLLDRVGQIMQSKGCNGCHRDGPEAPAPSLEHEVLARNILARLNSPNYSHESKALDKLDVEPFVSFRSARLQVRQEKGLTKARTWLRFHLLEPHFDKPDAQMPKLGISEEEATLIADHLIKKPRSLGLLARIKRMMADFIPKPRQRHLIMFFFSGIVVGIVCWWVLILLAKGIRRILGRHVL